MKHLLFSFLILFIGCGHGKYFEGQRLYVEGETSDYYVFIQVYFQHSFDNCRLKIIELKEKEKLHWKVWHIKEITAYDYDCDDVIDKVIIKDPRDVITYWRYKDIVDNYIINAYYSIVGEKTREI